MEVITMRSTTDRRRARRGRATDPVPPAEPRIESLVEELVDLLELAAGAAAHHGGLLAHLADPGDGSGDVHLGLLPLDGDHPLHHLIGLEAPADWTALGVHVSGRARHLAAAGEESEAVQVVVAVSRAGVVTGRIRWPGGRTERTPSPEGLVVDACLRTFGLPTPGPEAGTADLWTALWVDRVATAWNDPARRPELRSWEAIEALHPARTRGHDGTLADAARAHAEAWSWERIRSAPTFLGLQDGPPTPSVVAWFDEGALARWLMSLAPPVDQIVADIAPLLGGELERRFRAAVGPGASGAPRS
jgi:hypothetical protein